MPEIVRGPSKFKLMQAFFRPSDKEVGQAHNLFRVFFELPGGAGICIEIDSLRREGSSGERFHFIGHRADGQSYHGSYSTDIRTGVVALYDY